MAEVVNSIFKFTCSVLKIANKLMDSLSVLVLFLLSKININKARIGPYSVARFFWKCLEEEWLKWAKIKKVWTFFPELSREHPRGRFQKWGQKVSLLVLWEELQLSQGPQGSRQAFAFGLQRDPFVHGKLDRLTIKLYQTLSSFKGLESMFITAK